MNVLVGPAKRIYRALLACYPADFRTEFGDEMQFIFTQCLEEHSRVSFGQTLAFCLREIGDLPGSLLAQHWLAIRKERVSVNALTESNDMQTEVHRPGTWGATFLAGLPHFFMGTLIGVSKLGVFDIYEVSQTENAIIGIGLAFMVIGVLAYGWWRRWPLWSASWYLYGTWVVLAILSLGIEWLDVRDSWRYTNALFLGWILLCIIGYFLILAQSRMHGLLSVAFLFPLLGVMFLEFIPNPLEGWLAIGLGTLSALTMASIVRTGSFRMGLWLVLGLNLIAGLALAYVGEYQIKDLPPNSAAHIPKFSGFLEALGFYSVLAFGIITMPFILRLLRNFGRHRLSS